MDIEAKRMDVVARRLDVDQDSGRGHKDHDREKAHRNIRV
jgi:hypothetical protein